MVLVEGHISDAEKGVLGLQKLVKPDGDIEYGYLALNGDLSVTWKTQDEYRKELER